jgi:DNA-binding transcriptional LysR family regulator
MEFKQLEMFLAVAEERSISRAAAKVFRTQPAVSMALARLEGELGSFLFHRSRERRFQLTRIGEVLHEYAKRMLALRDEAAEVVAKRTVECSQVRPVN